jgi:hypothetical protein
MAQLMAHYQKGNYVPAFLPYNLSTGHRSLFPKTQNICSQNSQLARALTLLFKYRKANKR